MDSCFHCMNCNCHHIRYSVSWYCNCPPCLISGYCDCHHIRYSVSGYCDCHHIRYCIIQYWKRTCRSSAGTRRLCGRTPRWYPQAVRDSAFQELFPVWRRSPWTSIFFPVQPCKQLACPVLKRLPACGSNHRIPFLFSSLQ